VSHILTSIIPENFRLWSKTTHRIDGRLMCVARRAGVTLMLVQDAAGWWHVTKLKGGRELDRKVVRHLPPRIERAVHDGRETR
jgi:hypothetical protein